jgi:hypothetical protein
MSMTALGINPWNELISINSVSDFAMVIVITSSADDVRQWIEQGSGSFSNGLIAVTSAQAEPALIPYLQSQPSTLHGMVSGIRGAAAYEQFRSQENGTGRALWDSYSYGLGAILLIVLLGGLYGRIINLKPKQKAGQPRKSSEKSKATESKGGNES